MNESVVWYQIYWACPEGREGTWSGELLELLKSWIGYRHLEYVCVKQGVFRQKYGGTSIWGVGKEGGYP